MIVQISHFAKYRFLISQSTDFSFRKVQIFHFAKYRFFTSQSTDFSLRKVQSFHFAKYRFFVSFHFVSQSTISPVHQHTSRRGDQYCMQCIWGILQERNLNTNPNTQRNVRLVLQDNPFQFVERDYLQTHGTTMGTKMTVVLSISSCPH